MTLPEPNFIERNPEVIERQVFETWEAKGGAPLAPTDDKAILLKVIAYRETLKRIGIQEAAKQNLLRYARFPMLDYLGEWLQTPRLDPEPAKTSLEFTLPGVHGSNVTFVAGTRRKSKDGKVVFETDADLVITAGSTVGTVKATCQTVGVVGNGYVAGQISVEVDPLPLLATCANINTTEGGAAKESDERYLQRLLLAPDGYSTAGPEDAYVFHALSASGAVADVSVDSPEPSEIEVSVLGDTGVPGGPILDLVEAALTPKSVRPMGDQVTVVACDQVNWALDAELKFYADANVALSLEAANVAINAFVDARRRKLGRDVMLQRLFAVLGVPGVYNVTLNDPPADVIVAKNQWANCIGITITNGGQVEDVEGGND
jgi:phage-related baseplate assembly protein